MTIKRKTKIFTNIVFFFFIFNFCQIAESQSFIKKNTIQVNKISKKGVSKEVYSRIEGYLKGRFYSTNLNRNLFQVSGIFMSISENGSNSSISFCDADSFDLCTEQHLAFQTLKRCEKISTEKCYLVFRGKEFLPTRNKKEIIIKDYFYISNDNYGQHADIHGKTLEEFNIPDD